MNNQHNTTKHLVTLLVLIFSSLHFLYAQDCAYLSKANDIFPDGKCAPVTVQWEVTYRGVSYSGTGKIEIQYDWDDGNPVEIIEATLNDAGLKEYIATHTHVYPTTGDVCNYHPRATLVVNGTVCTSSVQEQIVTVWDTDDRNGGELAIDPKVYPICVGNGATFHFTDNSQWNCTPPDENDVINNEDRWIQWIYGTGGTTITDAQVGGVVQAYPYTGNIEYIPGPVEGPIAPYNTSLEITIPDYYPVGSFFEVTLRNWNVCNPYDADLSDGLPPGDILNGDYPPVTTTAMALIVALPDATIQNVPAVCVSDDPFYLIAVDAGGQWSGPGIANSNSSLFDPKLAGPGTHTITYSIVDGNGCSDVGTVDITVLGGPTANILQGDQISLCPGVTVQLDGNPSGGLSPYTHLWKGDVSYIDDVSIQTPEFSTLSVGVYELVYRVTDDNGCFDEDTVDVNVESVDISFVNSTIEVCQGETVVLNPLPSGGSGTFVFHQWTGTRVDKLSDTNIQNPEFNTDEIGTFTYTYTVKDSQNCEDSDDITVVVHEQPTANAGVDINECGLGTTLDAISSVGAGLWKVVSGTGVLSFSAFDEPDPTITSDIYGTYNLRWVEANYSCSDSADISVNFIEIPSPAVMDDKDTCGLSMELIAFAHIGSSLWTKTEGPGNAIFADDTNDSTMVTVDTPGEYKFVYTEDNGGGCIGSDTVIINFYQVPDANIVEPPATVCTPFEMQFENTTTNADSYYWDFGNGNISTEKDPVQIFSNNTPNALNYDIVLITKSANGCSDTINTSITVAPAPVSYFEMDNSVGCSPLTTDFINKSQGGDSYEWTYGDASPMETTENTSHTFVNEENYIQSFGVQLVTKNNYGCTDTSKLYTTVYPKQNFNLVASPDSGCSPLNVSFIADPGAFKYEWDLGDGNIDQGVNQNVKLFTNESASKEQHTITLYTTSVYGCLDTAETVVTVLPSPTTDFEPNDFSTCSPKQVLFINNTSDIEYSYWNFGDGNSLTVEGNEQVEHTYVNEELTSENYKIRLITENSFGCKDSMDGFTTVNPSVTASISGGVTACSPFEIQFDNQSIGAQSYLWDFDDGNTSNNILGVNTFENSGNEAMDFEVSMVASSVYGCSDTAYTTVTVLPSPDTYFEPNDFAICSPKQVLFINNTSDIEYSYWNFGDGNSLTVSGNEQVEHTYVNEELTSQDYKIRLVTENSFGCKDSMDGFTTVNPAVTANISGGVTACSPFEIQFGNQSVGAQSYLWDFDDGNTSNSILGVNTFENPGDEAMDFEVSMIASSVYGCSDTAYTTVTILPSPDTYFEPNDFSVCSPKKVEFTNYTENIIKSYWTFGDGASESIDGNQSIEHTYYNEKFTPLDYRIRLITENSFGCKDSMDGYTSVNPNVEAVITGSGEGCSPMEITLGNESVGANDFVWDFGDGNTSANYLGLNKYVNETTEDKLFEVSLIAKSIYGCSDTAYTSVNVFATPQPDFTVTPEYQQMPESTVDLDNVTSGSQWSYEWEFGDGKISNVAEPEQHTYLNSGSFTIVLKAYNEQCESSTEKTIEIIPNLPVVSYGPSSEGCPALTVEFYSETLDATNFFWEFGDGNVSADANPVHTYYTAGEYNVVLTVTGPGGQTIKDDLIVNVYPEPTAFFEAYPKVVTIPGQSVTFANKSVEADNYVWDFGNGDSSTEQNPVYEYSKAGNYDVSLEASNEYGCVDVYELNEPIIAEEGGDIEFPNAFTPNTSGESSGEYIYGDKNNYVFYPTIQEGIEEYKLQIYSRWGQLLFESHDIKVGWNGYYKGSLCAQGVYIWKVTCRFGTGQVKVYTGDVTLIR